MNDLRAELIAIEVAGWKVITAAMPPTSESSYRAHAQLHEEFGYLDRHDIRGYLFAAVGRGDEDWPGLVVSQWFSPSVGGFSPGVLIVPEREVSFIGAGTRLLCYGRADGRWMRLWEDAADVGFWGWRRSGDVVVMSAEIEMAAWNVTGEKLWTTFVEPPWSYAIIDGTVQLDVMGTLSSFPLESGPAAR